LGIYAIRRKYSWFFINPVALIPALWVMPYMWFQGILVLIIKLIAVRAVGVVRYEKYVTPAVSGAILGYGAPYLFTGLAQFFMNVLPKIYSLYVP